MPSPRGQSKPSLRQRSKESSKKQGSERRRGGVEPLEQILKSYLSDTGLDRQLRKSVVMQAWSEALGPALAKRVRATRFHQGELRVEVESAAHLQELKNFTGEHLRQAANQRLGAERILRVTFQLRT